ncbi:MULTISPECIES: endonuclease domain-containing protein [Nocardioides]|uniref:Endonuclease domain-containing protein n=1 Tax=Nocardioides vastitatis TaxID=2568655 RepID=A0ABW0ZKN5_9ACTN|nr:hypothetical protein [Nocardioides sp.]
MAVVDGLLRRPVRGSYRPRRGSDNALADLAAVALARPHDVFIDRTAALIHGVDAYTRAEHDLTLSVEMCALRGSDPTELTGVDGRTRDLAPDDIVEVHGLRVTTPLRTAMDLGCNLRRREAFAAMNELARHHRLTVADLAASLPRFRGRRGVVQLRQLIALLEPRVESQRESWTLLAIVDAGLPRPEPQHWIVLDGVPTFRLDFAYPGLRACVEYDGVDAHQQVPAQLEHDRQRRDWLRDHGWTVIVVRNGDFTGPALDRWLRELRAALATSYSVRRF